MAHELKRYHPPGTPPGELVEDEQRKNTQPLRLTVIDYDAEHWTEKKDASIDDCLAPLATPEVTWIHAQGYAGPDTLRQLGEAFGLHPLALEDVLNTGQRPKVDSYGEQLFAILSLPVLRDNRITSEQLSIFLGKDYLVSFFSGESDPFELIRQRLRSHRGPGRNRHTDYLFYSLIDLVIDEGFPVLESVGEWIEDLEEKLLGRPDKDTLNEIHRLRRELLYLRRMLWPQREILNTLLRDEFPVIAKETKIYLRDCYDHTIQIMDLMESYRDTAASMTDIYLSSVSNRLNEVLRVLALITTLFIPPTFIVGVYGMNFSHPNSPWAMPELSWYYGYPMVWGIIIVTVIIMVVYFKRKRLG